MSSKFEKIVAKRELMRRQGESVEKKVKAIESLSDEELNQIIAEPDEDEKPGRP